MGKKRKHSETVLDVKKDEIVTERLKQTLLGWKDKTNKKESDVNLPRGLEIKKRFWSLVRVALIIGSINLFV